MSRTTQTSQIVSYLKEHPEGLTSMQAFHMFGATRLAAIIFNLRQRGYNIETFDMESTNRYGEAVRYAKYIYRGEN